VTVPYFAHSDPTSSSSSSSTSPGPTFQKKREIFSKFSSSFMNPKNEAWDRHFILKPYSIWNSFMYKHVLFYFFSKKSERNQIAITLENRFQFHHQTKKLKYQRSW
jgi:hypothetical protein